MNFKVHIDRKKEGGPNIFLSRLEKEFKKSNILIDSKNPDIVLSTKDFDTDGILALRLDGLDHENHSYHSINNKLYYRYNNLKILIKLNKVIQTYMSFLHRNLINPVLNFYFLNKHNRKQIKAYFNANLVIFQSEFSKKYYEIFLGKCNKPNFIIKNGVDLASFNPENKIDNEVKKIMNSDFNIITSASFRVHKRLQDGLILFKKILTKIPNSKYFVLGKLDNQTNNLIKRIISYYKLENNVVFLGHVPVQSLPNYYSRADLMIYPSWLDPCPNTVVECLSSGTPVVCPDSGGVKELVGSGGIVVPENKFPKVDFTDYYCVSKIPRINYSLYLKAVLEIKKNLRLYSENARKVAERDLDIKKISNQYIQAFNKIKKNVHS